MASWITIALALIQVFQGVLIGGDKIRKKRAKHKARVEIVREESHNEEKK